MVTIKGTLPFKSSPHPANSSQGELFIPSRNDLNVDAADLPPIPDTVHHRQNVSHEGQSYEEENPWADNSDQQLRVDRPLPDILKPRNGQPHEGNQRYSLQDVPQMLRDEQPEIHTPRTSSDSDRSKDFWEDDDDQDEDYAKEQSHGYDEHSDMHNQTTEATTESSVQDHPSAIKRKPIPMPASLNSDNTGHQDFASNNPFRRPSQEANESQPSHPPQSSLLPAWNNDIYSDAWKGKQVEREDVGTKTLTNELSNMNMGQTRPLMLQSTSPFKSHAATPPAPTHQPPPPPVPVQPLSPFSSQPPLIPASSEQDSAENPWASQTRLASTPMSIPFDDSLKQSSHYNENLLQRGQESGLVSLEDEMDVLPNNANPPAKSSEQPSLLLDDMDPPPPPKPARNISQFRETEYQPPPGPPPGKPSRPVIVTTKPSEAEVAKMIEQRNETYQIKHFNWFDQRAAKIRRSSMLIQNQNGPCPLLALVNALILGAQDESQAALDDALRSREQVSLGLIIETLMDELLSRGFQSDSGTLPDVDELNAFLMRLRTGMNANPSFVPPAAAPNLMDARNSMLHLPQMLNQVAGTFEVTSDLKLYGAFSVPLLHGWLPEPGSDAAEAFARSAPTYEDAQALQFGEEELEYKLSRDGLTQHEQQIWEDINSIKSFLRQFPTQLSPYGLNSLHKSLQPGSFAIMFRNDHFSTIYKHPDNQKLYTLITDAGYSDRDEIIWESLVDINGTNGGFFSGDFMSVSHDQSETTQNVPSQSETSQGLSEPALVPPMSPQEQQEQHDADYAMALQLQEEEEQRQRADQARRRSGTGRQSGNIPIPLRSQQESRPSIPPRTSRTQNPGVNRPADEGLDDAPPAYEEAAKGKPYVPPIGSPLHPGSDISPMSSNTQLTGTVSNPGPSSQIPQSPTQPQPPGAYPAGRRQAVRRSSAYMENSSQYGPSLTPRTNQAIPPPSPGAAPGSSRRSGSAQDRDCTVM